MSGTYDRLLNQDNQPNQLKPAGQGSKKSVARPNRPKAKPTPTSKPVTTELRKPVALPRSNRAESIELALTDEQIELLRSQVKGSGQLRGELLLNQEEKDWLRDMVYEFSRVGIKTSNIEIVRTGLRLIMEDHKANERESVLTRTLEALRA